MATPTSLILPAPPSNAGSNWNKAWAAYQADPAGGYAAYYNFLAQGKTSGPLLQQGNYPTPGSAGAPTSPGIGLTGSATGAVPIGAPVPINVGGMANPISRFGPGGIGAYTVGTSYAGPESPPGAPAGGPAPAPAGLLSTGAPGAVPVPAPAIPGASAPVPPPTSALVPAGPVGPGARPAGGGAGGLLSTGGNGPAGNPAAPAGAPSSWGSSQNYIDLPGWADNLWSAASMSPGWTGAGIGAAHGAARAYQTANSDALNSKLGGGGLDLGQWAGGILGTNRYGDLTDPQIMNKEMAQGVYPGATAGVSPGGVYEPGFLSRIFGGTTVGEYTPDEFADRKYMSNVNMATWDPNVNTTGTAGTAAPQKTYIDANNNLVVGGVVKGPAGANAMARYGSGSGGGSMGPGGIFNASGGGWNQASGGGYSTDGSARAGTTYRDAGGNTASVGASGMFGHMMKGGFVPGRADLLPDNRRIRANEGEFVVRNAAAKAAPKLLRAINASPALGRHLQQGLLSGRRRGLLSAP